MRCRAFFLILSTAFLFGYLVYRYEDTTFTVSRFVDHARPTASLESYRSDDHAFVRRVIDGDTIELENGERVRYIGIDTPETIDPRKAVQCFGKEASEKNRKLVEGKRVRLVRDIADRDRYGRLLRYVYVDDLFVNLELVRSGFGYAATFPPDVAHASTFREAEQHAREALRGLWSSCR